VSPGEGAAAVELDPRITRRDLLNATLLGAGAALLHGCGARPDAEPSAGDPAAAWDGPSGSGEYRGSNGATWRTMEAGHRIRDGAHQAATAVRDTGESYDLIVVGGGFAGLGALHAFRKEHPRGTCLLLDNQEMFGGYAKANEFEVDGYRVAGAQASLNFVLPRDRGDRGGALWAELGLPERLRFAEREDGQSGFTFASSSSGPLYFGEQTATTGYFFGERNWVTDIWRDDLQRAPWPPEMKAALLAMRARRRQGPLAEPEARRLDAMTFAEFATRELKATPDALRYITQGMCITGPQISAYGARSFPGLERYPDGSAEAELAGRFVSFPEGNAVLARALVRSAIPDAVRAGPAGEGHLGHLVPAALDRPGGPARIRLRATVVKVVDRPGGAVDVVYEMGGALYRVRARAVVLGIGAWVSKHIVQDLPDEHRAALDCYLYAPMLMVNVALRNWRFLDKLGFSAARWFDGDGFYANIRRPMLIDGVRPAPFHPDKPIVMTLYAPFPRPGLPLEAQGPDARAELHATSYADFERRIVTQLQRLFGPAGFDARRDVAGIVLNRWGHAFVTPPPGFYFAPEGRIAPAKVHEHPLDRIAFCPSEDWLGSALGGAKAVSRVLS
jgi:spermidine dehydrogenase